MARVAELAASIGLRVKTGRAIAVVLRGPTQNPAILFRRELALADPKDPNNWQPFHRFIDLAWEDALAAVRPTAAAIEKSATAAIAGLAHKIQAAGLTLRGAGIVGSGSQDPASIGNPHIRAHAAEGRLYREVLEHGAEACGLAWLTFLERNIWGEAGAEIDGPPDVLKKRVADLGAGRVKPWRADEKAAALAAWIVLATRRGLR